MGKIGDLFVRLGLTSDNFKKGIRNAQQEVQNFGKKLGNMKAGALAAWAAIGTAVTKVGKDFISATNKMNDAWEATMAKMKAEYHAFLAAMSNTNFGIDTSGSGNKVVNAIKNEVQWWKKLFGTVKEAGAAAKEMADAFDAEFELTQSVRLQRQAIQQELNELYAQMRDTTLSNADRRAAADRYKALLQPIADAEVAVYGNMLNEAVKAWQAGMELDRVYSTDEMVEFFSKIGTEYEKMEAKFPDLMRIYETRKGDAQNQVIFDTIAKLQQATNQMPDIDRELSRIINRLKAEEVRALEQVRKAVLGIRKAARTDDLLVDLKKSSKDFDYSSIKWDDLDIVYGVDITFATDDIDTSDIDALTEQIIAKQKERVDEMIALNGMLEQSFISSMSGGLQAVTDMLFGIEGAGPEQVLAALLQPFAQTATQLGEMLIAQGLAIGAFKESLKSLQPGVAIAAGTTLLAVGAALSSGIQALAGGPRGTTTEAGASTGRNDIETYEQEITVHVVGEISGNNIVLAGQKTLNKWNR